LYVCGGGAHNAGLLEALARLVAPDPAASAGSVTRAEGARILGGVYRYA
jgi:1,6-anhydro-N-acetylmuramate kinase